MSNACVYLLKHNTHRQRYQWFSASVSVGPLYISFNFAIIRNNSFQKHVFVYSFINNLNDDLSFALVRFASTETFRKGSYQHILAFRFEIYVHTLSAASGIIRFSSVQSLVIRAVAIAITLTLTHCVGVCAALCTLYI